MTEPVVTIAITVEGVDRRFEICGECAVSLIALVAAGDRGVTSIEYPGELPGMGTSCAELQQRYGLDIRTERNSHRDAGLKWLTEGMEDPGEGITNRVLLTPVQIISVDSAVNPGSAQ